MDRQCTALTVAALQQQNLEEAPCIKHHDNDLETMLNDFKPTTDILNRSRPRPDGTPQSYHGISSSLKYNASTSSSREISFQNRRQGKTEPVLEDIGIAGIRMRETSFLGIGAQFEAQYSEADQAAEHDRKWCDLYKNLWEISLPSLEAGVQKCAAGV